MKKLLAIFFILLFSFCSKRQNKYPQLITENAENVIQVNTKEMLTSGRGLIALNFTKDTKSNIEKIFKGFPKGFPNLTENFCSNVSDTILPKVDLKVIIDTTYKFYSQGFIYKDCRYPKIDWKRCIDENCAEGKKFSVHLDKIEKLTSKFVEAYPVLIYNNSNTNASIGKSVPLIQEAKDTDGKWKPIEYFWSHVPGGGCIITPNFLLKHKQYMATSIIKYHGDFKTKIRVKYQNQWNTYYSNEITGYINHSQFNKKPFLDNYENSKSDGSANLDWISDFVFLRYWKFRNKNIRIGM
jgi:hypothetical protein